MKFDWMKDILGDAYTEEMDAKVCTAVGERFVAKADYNTKVGKLKEAEVEVETLKKAVGERDKQLKTLQDSAGDNEDLKKQIETLTEQNKTERANHEKELARVKLMNTVDAELNGAGARNTVAVSALLQDFLKDASILDGKVVSKVNGETVTLAAQLEALKKAEDSSFLFKEAGKKRDGWTPGDSGDNGGSGAPDFSEMTYEQMCEYTDSHPDE